MAEGEIHQFGVVVAEAPPKGPTKIRQFGQGLYHTKVIKPLPAEVVPVEEDDEDAPAKKAAK